MMPPAAPPPGVMTPHDALTTFLYLLMRDEVPVGAVARVVCSIERLQLSSHAPALTATGLADYAAELAARLLGPTWTAAGGVPVSEAGKG